METLTGMERTNNCGELRISDVDKEVKLAGWVSRRRDHGGLIFVDMRDRSGIVQLAFDEDTEKEIFEKANSVRSEYVLMAQGTVRERSAKIGRRPSHLGRARYRALR